MVSGNLKVLRLCTRQCSIACSCSEAEASSSSLLLVIIYFQYLFSFFFSFILQVSLSLGVVPSPVEFFPPASLLMSPSCLLTQHVTRGVASLAGCICICMQVRVLGWCLGPWGSGAPGLLGLWGALWPGPGGAHCRPRQGAGRGCASLLFGLRSRPLLVIQRAPRRAAVQPQCNTARARAFKLLAYGPKFPPQAC